MVASGRRPAQPKTVAAKPGARAPAKSIVLFSDGTGNSSAKLFKTNVWRMYEALDLGPAEAGKQRQIAFYDDGVGTSAFRPIALLGGIFGYGLKRNVLDLYSYVCRNYDPASVASAGSKIQEPGDHIYGFGFSRGAFTMRLAIAMIADQGIIPYTTEEELQRKVEAAYEDFRRSRTRRAFQWFRETFGKNYDEERQKARVTERVKRKTGYDRTTNYRPIIRFIGVWDTVAAYGGPVVEITRAVDTWFYPLSMPDYKLSKHVRRARHALALDDERDSFWPLLWDEIAEKELSKSKPAGFDWIDRERLRQVWFTGMHADVGGGYPDESLSYVSLLWMIAEAQDCDLRTIDTITERYRSLTNSFGPMHDSRSGIGAYYRYQPRKIAAWLEPVRKSTLSLRDPEVRDDRKKVRKGLIQRPLVHESAIVRIASGTDGYSPIVLPDNFEIVRDQSRQTAPLATSGGTQLKGQPKKCPPLLAPSVRRQLAVSGIKQAITTSMESAWDLVWRRRVTYFANVITTSFLLLWPAFAGQITDTSLARGSESGWRMLFGNIAEILGNLIRLVARPLPDFTNRWTDAWANAPYLFLALVLVIWRLRRVSSNLEMRLRDRARAIWHAAVPRIPPATAGQPPVGIRSHVSSRLEKMRNSARFQRGLQIVKWSILPQLAALVMLFLAVWLLFAVAMRIALPFGETRNAFCSAHPETGFRTDRLCNDSGENVQPNTDYVVTFDVTEQWKDGSYEADPQGVAAGRMKWLIGYWAVPFRRVTNAAYLQPIAEVRSRPAGGRGKVTIQALRFEPVPGVANRFEARFTPTIGGRLYLFANDAVSPFDRDYFYTAKYAKNLGTADVSVVEADRRK